MKEPLEFIFNNEIPEGYNRSIFLLTGKNYKKIY